MRVRVLLECGCVYMCVSTCVWSVGVGVEVGVCVCGHMRSVSLSLCVCACWGVCACEGIIRAGGCLCVWMLSLSCLRTFLSISLSHPMLFVSISLFSALSLSLCLLYSSTEAEKPSGSEIKKRDSDPR